MTLSGRDITRQILSNETSREDTKVSTLNCNRKGQYLNLSDRFPNSGINTNGYWGDGVYSTNATILMNCSGNNSNVSDYDEYFYDYSDADLSLPLDEFLPVSLLYGITLMVGVVGNLLVIAAVARDRRLRSITNIFLTSLATADLSLLCFCVPVKLLMRGFVVGVLIQLHRVIAVILGWGLIAALAVAVEMTMCVAFFSFTWAFGFFLCKAINYLQTVTMVCSVMTLTVMSIERHIAILSPLRSKSICTRGRARIVIFALWIGSFVLALPILIGQKHKPVGRELIKAFWCLKEWEHRAYGVLYESYMLVLLFLVPVGVMVFSYTSICLELCKGTQFRRQAMAEPAPGYHSNVNGPRAYRTTPQAAPPSTSHGNVLYSKHKEKIDHEKMKVIRMLIVVVVLFAVCWGPILINNLLIAVGVLHTLHLGKLKPFRQTIFLMSYLNSSLNPLVYGFMSRHFRRGFREAICVCCSRSASRGQSRFGQMWQGPNKNHYYSDGQTSIVRTGTIRLSPVSETISVKDSRRLETLSGSVRFKNYPPCQKVWARRSDSPSTTNGIEEI